MSREEQYNQWIKRYQEERKREEQRLQELRAWYRMNATNEALRMGGAAVSAGVGGGGNPSPAGDVSTWDGIDRVLQFANSNSYLEDLTGTFTLPETVFGISFWIYPTDVMYLNNHVIISKWSTGQKAFLLKLIKSGDQFYFRFFTSNDGTSEDSVVWGAPPTNQWSFVTIGRDANGYDVYINDYNEALNINSLTINQSSTAPFYIGRGSLGEAPLNMYLDELSFWSKNPSQAEHLAMFNNNSRLTYATMNKTGLIEHFAFDDDTNIAVGVHAGTVLSNTNAIAAVLSEIAEDNGFLVNGNFKNGSTGWLEIEPGATANYTTTYDTSNTGTLTIACTSGTANLHIANTYQMTPFVPYFVSAGVASQSNQNEVRIAIDGITQGIGGNQGLIIGGEYQGYVMSAGGATGATAGLLNRVSIQVLEDTTIQLDSLYLGAAPLTLVLDETFDDNSNGWTFTTDGTPFQSVGITGGEARFTTDDQDIYDSYINLAGILDTNTDYYIFMDIRDYGAIPSFSSDEYGIGDDNFKTFTDPLTTGLYTLQQIPGSGGTDVYIKFGTFNEARDIAIRRLQIYSVD